MERMHTWDIDGTGGKVSGGRDRGAREGAKMMLFS